MPISKRGRVIVALLCAAMATFLLPVAGAGGAAKPPKAGKYAGKVGTFARIIFTVRGRVVLNFNSGVKTNCQRTSDGFITETKNLATAPAEQEPKARLGIERGRRWTFGGKAQDKSGVEWIVKGRFVSPRKAKGTFEASQFESVFNPSQPFGIDGQLCAGSGEWTAVLKGGKKRKRARR